MNDIDLTIEDDGGSYSYLLQELTYYTEYTFTLSTVYGNSTSDTVTTSTITTPEGSKYIYIQFSNFRFINVSVCHIMYLNEMIMDVCIAHVVEHLPRSRDMCV